MSDPSHGDTVEWGCQNDYWVSRGVTEFSNTCSARTWDPRVQNCTEKPTCTVPSIPQNGNVNSIATIFHVDDAISYTCNFGYTLQGSADKLCTLNETDDITYWSPSGDVDCSVIECALPSISNARLLLGRRESNPIHGDTVFWGCQDSYWISNGVTEFSSTCLAGSWIPALQNCTRKPRCSSPTVPEHGGINSTASNFYVDDAVSFSCDLGYNLEGPAEKQCRYLAIFWGFSFWSPWYQVNCITIECLLPSIAHADKQRGSSNPRHGDIIEWSCQKDYWIRHGVTEFNSTCSAGTWDPPVQICTEKPRCSAPSIPGNGSINSTATEFHVDDTISYSCNSGYSHQGVEVQNCFYDGNTTYWSPYGDAYCNVMQCLDLLPQPNGHYSPATSQHYYTGDTVELVCDPGYYAREPLSHPETAQLCCLGTDWSPSQLHCHVILQVAVSTLYINRVDGHVWYGISSLENTSVPSNLYEFACNQMIGEHLSYEYVGRATRYRTVYRVRHYFEGWTSRTRVVTRLVPYSVIVLRCYTRLSITDGPTIYDGILAIHTRNGVEKACIEESSDARLVCIHLGYQEYTTLSKQCI